MECGNLQLYALMMLVYGILFSIIITSHAAVKM